MQRGERVRRGKGCMEKGSLRKEHGGGGEGERCMGRGA